MVSSELPTLKLIDLFVCFLAVDRPTREFSTHMDYFTITGGGLRFLTYARHSWLLSSEGSLACHTYSDTGWSSPRTRDAHSYCREVSSRAVTTSFFDLGLSRLDFEHSTFRMRSQPPVRCHKWSKSTSVAFE